MASLDGEKWSASVRRAVRDPAELLRLLDLPEALLDRLDTHNPFPLFAPRPFIARMRRGDPHDPLLRQVLPLDAENHPVAGFSRDAVDDAAAELTPGLLQKYPGRVLLVVTGACAVHCRYCFRRHFPYSQAPKSLAAWSEALGRIAADDSIREVILSGGDPLMVRDHLLAELAERIASIPHVRRLRVHSRLPIVIPGRVDEQLLAWLRGTRLTPLMVVHANHPREIDESVAKAFARLIDAGIPVLNQTVLLSGVNDSVEVLAELSERLLDCRVLPYYLHQLDRVAGAAHFEVPVEKGRQIIARLRERLPGFAVPRYVREIAGELSKTVLEC